MGRLVYQFCVHGAQVARGITVQGSRYLRLCDLEADGARKYVRSLRPVCETVFVVLLSAFAEASGCDLARRIFIMAMGAATIVGQIADIEVAGQWKAADDAVGKVWDLLERSVQLTPEKYRNGYRDITVGWTQDDLDEA